LGSKGVNLIERPMATVPWYILCLCKQQEIIDNTPKNGLLMSCFALGLPIPWEDWEGGGAFYVLLLEKRYWFHSRQLVRGTASEHFETFSGRLPNNLQGAAILHYC
jgi:hypothetical protein